MGRDGEPERPTVENCMGDTLCDDKKFASGRETARVEIENVRWVISCVSTSDIINAH